jgi:hypothetical protein
MTGILHPRLRPKLRFHEMHQPPAIPEHTDVLPGPASTVRRGFSLILIARLQLIDLPRDREPNSGNKRELQRRAGKPQPIRRSNGGGNRLTIWFRETVHLSRRHNPLYVTCF